MFVLSTHYDGNEPDDATEFFKQLKQGKLDLFFKNKKVVIFGLGDSNYDEFNKFAVDVDQIMLKIKATVFHK